jgi:tetratricopeptide (TPR) repeat protein
VAREFAEERPDDPLRKRLLATSYAGLSYVDLNSLEPDKAVRGLRAALQIFGADASGAEDHDRILATFYGRLGLALNERGSNAEAIASYETAIAIAEELARRVPSQRAKRSVFALYNNLVGPLAGREILNAGEAREAQRYSRKALALAEEAASGDPTNMQGRSDLAYAYTKMGDSIVSTTPAKACEWYRKAIVLTKELGSRSDAARDLADRDETLAAVLITKAQASERLHLLQEAVALRQQIAMSSRNSPRDRLHLMRSYCRLSDAELSTERLVEGRRHAELSLPFFDEFQSTSPSLLVLRDLGFCYETLGNAQHSIAVDRWFSVAQRRAAEAQAPQWYLRSLSAWKEWARRGAATPDSEAEKHKLERRLHPKG